MHGQQSSTNGLESPVRGRESRIRTHHCRVRDLPVRRVPVQSVRHVPGPRSTIHGFLGTVHFPVLVVEPLAVMVSVGILTVVAVMAWISRHGVGILAEITLEEQPSNARLHGPVRAQQDALERPSLPRCAACRRWTLARLAAPAMSANRQGRQSLRLSMVLPSKFGQAGQMPHS